MQSNVNALKDVKLEKVSNLREESSFFWREINDGTLRIDRTDMRYIFVSVHYMNRN